MKNVQLSNKAFASPSKPLPLLVDHIRAKLKKNGKAKTNDLLLPRVYDFVLADGKAFIPSQSNGVNMCRSCEPLECDRDNGSFLHSTFSIRDDNKGDDPLFGRVSAFGDVDASFVSANIQNGSFQARGDQEENSKGCTLFLSHAAVVTSLWGKDSCNLWSKSLAIQDESPLASSDASDEDCVSLAAHVGIERMHLDHRTADLIKNGRFNNQSACIALASMVLFEGRQEHSSPCLEKGWPCLLESNLGLNDISSSKSSIALVSGLLDLPQENDINSLSTIFHEQDSGTEMKAIANLFQHPHDWDLVALMHQEDSPAASAQCSQLYLATEVSKLLFTDINLCHKKVLDSGCTQIKARTTEKLPAFLVNEASLTSKLYEDIVLSSCSSPFLDTSKLVLYSWERSLMSETMNKTFLVDFDGMKMSCHNSERMYLDWSILTGTSGDSSTNTDWLQCFQPIERAYSQPKNHTFSLHKVLLSEWLESQNVHPTFAVADTGMQKENCSKCSESQGEEHRKPEAQKDPISYYQSLYSLKRADQHSQPFQERKVTERVIEIDLNVHQNNVLNAIRADYESIYDYLPHSIHLSLQDYDLFDSECVFTMRERLKTLDEESQVNSMVRANLICCMLLRQIAIGVIEYGCTFGSMILSINIEKMEAKYWDIKQFFTKSKFALNEAVTEIERTPGCIDNSKQEKLREQIRSAILTQSDRGGKRASILILAHTNAFFTISTFASQGGAQVWWTQMSRNDEDEAYASSEDLSGFFTDALKTHNCIFWSCEDIMDGFPFFLFTHVFVYSSSGIGPDLVGSIKRRLLLLSQRAEDSSLSIISFEVERKEPAHPSPPPSDRGSLCNIPQLDERSIPLSVDFQWPKVSEDNVIDQYIISSDDEAHRIVEMKPNAHDRMGSVKPSTYEWDSNSILENWNHYRNQRHYSETTQAFLGRKPKRRKTRPWPRKRKLTF